ncbi:MAG: hypothetical protein ACPHOG_12560 [Verrucomicrobiales bacterium]
MKLGRGLRFIVGLILFLSFSFLLAIYGYHLSLRNVIEIKNVSSNSWQDVHLLAGGKKFKLDEVNDGQKETLKFHSEAEDGGMIEGQFNGQKYSSEISYFTPNMSTKAVRTLGDAGEIKIVEKR